MTSWTFAHMGLNRSLSKSDQQRMDQYFSAVRDLNAAHLDADATIDGLVLVGDAACFVDPVFSTGVHLVWDFFFNVLTDELKRESVNVDQVAVAGLGAIAAIFFLILQIGQYSYLVDCLYAERKDRSILFWKSLPASDTATVLSKLVFALLVMPAIAAASSFWFIKNQPIREMQIMPTPDHKA